LGGRGSRRAENPRNAPARQEPRPPQNLVQPWLPRAGLHFRPRITQGYLGLCVSREGEAPAEPKTPRCAPARQEPRPPQNLVQPWLPRAGAYIPARGRARSFCVALPMTVSRQWEFCPRIVTVHRPGAGSFFGGKTGHRRATLPPKNVPDPLGFSRPGVHPVNGYPRIKQGPPGADLTRISVVPIVASVRLDRSGGHGTLFARCSVRWGIG